MPIIIIAAAAGSFIAGAAIATAAGATLGAMIVGGAMMVGAAMTIVGTITENKNLARWGAILSIAGGIGSLAIGAFEGVAVAADAGGGIANASAADITAQTAGVAEGESVGSVLNGAAPGADAATAAAAAPAAGDPTGLLASQSGPAAPAAPAVDANVAAPSPVAATPDATSSFNAPAPQSPNAFQPGAQSTTSAFNPAPVSDAAAPVPGTAPGAGSSTGYFDAAGRWIRQNPEAARAAFNGVGLLASSVVPKPLNAEQRARAALYQREADKMDPNSAWWKQPSR